MTDHKLRLPVKVRNALREYADEREMTYSEALEDILPEDEAAYRVDRGVSVWIEIDTPAHKRLDALTGRGVDRAEVIGHFINENTEITV